MHEPASAPRQPAAVGEIDAATEALDLLARSAADSCASCARDHRRRAFALLDEQFPPGAIARSDSLRRFTRASASENELVFASRLGIRGDEEQAGPETRSALGRLDRGPRLTFRFHTATDRLVGISDADLTDEGLASLCRSATDGALLEGALEIIPFAYGDGLAFLYIPSSRTVQIQCRVLEIRQN